MRNARKRKMGKFSRRLIGGAQSCAAILIVGGSWSLYLSMTASDASAATLGGTATIASPTGSNPPLPSGGSATVFTVTLPSQAACSGDTTSHQYHVFSYLLPQGTAVTTDDFVTQVPSEGLGLVDANGDYYGPANTAPVSGQIIDIPNDFEWAGLLKVGETASKLDGGGGIWNAGLACANSSGAVTDYWNTQVTFTASGGDPNGFVWSAVPGVATTTTTTTTTSTSTTTTAAGSTTTTTAGGSTTTSTPGGSTATTTGSTSSGSGSSATKGAATAAASGEGTSGTTAASSGSLAFTGVWATRGLAIGLLCIGGGLILLGISLRWRRDVAHRLL